jgi:hypothetical protein
MGTDFAQLITSIAVIFLVIRGIVLWYWRVNEGIELLKGIDAKLGLLTANPSNPVKLKLWQKARSGGPFLMSRLPGRSRLAN